MTADGRALFARHGIRPSPETWALAWIRNNGEALRRAGRWREIVVMRSASLPGEGREPWSEFRCSAGGKVCCPLTALMNPPLAADEISEEVFRAQGLDKEAARLIVEAADGGQVRLLLRRSARPDPVRDALRGALFGE